MGGQRQERRVRAEALKQLAWAKSPAGVQLAIDALTVPVGAAAGHGRPRRSPSTAVRSVEPSKDALLAALKKAGPGAKPQIAWALVVLGEPRAFDDIMVLYRAG